MCYELSSARVTARWDGKTEEWVATSDDIPGLRVSALTEDELSSKIRAALPKLMRESFGYAAFDGFDVEYVKTSIRRPLVAA